MMSGGSIAFIPISSYSFGPLFRDNPFIWRHGIRISASCMVAFSTENQALVAMYGGESS